MWNPKKSLQSLAVLTNQPSAFAPGTWHTDVRGGNKQDPFCRSLQREEKEYRARVPGEMVARPTQRQHAHRFPSSKTDIEGIHEPKQKSILPSCSNSTSREEAQKWCQNKHKNEMEITLSLLKNTDQR